MTTINVLTQLNTDDTNTILAAIADINNNETKLLTIKNLVFNSDELSVNADLLDAIKLDTAAIIANKKDSYSIDDTQFKTNFKFAAKEEQAIFSRYVNNAKHTKTNRYMFYMLTNDSLQFKNDGKYFYDSNKHLTERFNEITNDEFVIVDKEFLENNEFLRKTDIGRRYIYYVSKDDFEYSTKETWKTSCYSKIHKHCKVFKSYEALVDHLETYVKSKCIYIIGEHAANALRYMIDEIQFAICSDLNVPDNAVEFNLLNWQKFLGFLTANKEFYTKTDKVETQITEDDEYFSNFIRFASTHTKKKHKLVDKTFNYVLLKITKSAGRLVGYRFAKRKGLQEKRFVQINNIIIETTDKYNDIINIETDAELNLLQNSTDYVMDKKVYSLVISNDNYLAHKELFDTLAKCVKIQIKS